ncbi:MAG TPA: competence protein ComK, partial [Savagea sp.]
MYTIHSQTIALLPKYDGQSDELHTYVIEMYRSFTVPYSPTQIVKRHVRKYAGSYNAQQERTMKYLGE